jgi:hypothetical protein
MPEHRVTREADFAVDAHTGRSRRRADETRAEVGLVLGNAVEPPEEIEVPPRSPQLSIGDAAQPQFSLLRDDALDLSILDGLQARGIERAFRVAATRRLERGGRSKLPTWSARNGGVECLAIMALAE